MRIHLTVLLLGLSLTSVAQNAAGPPVPYVLQDICPFECCTYREWTAKSQTILWANDTEVAAQAAVVKAGETVKALTGHVSVASPGRIRVLKDFVGSLGTKYQKGDVVWVYSSVGEGNHVVWYQGRFYTEEATFFGDGRDRCEVTNSCWGETLELPKSVWWVHIETPNGTRGWTNQPERFDNKDGCGQQRVARQAHGSRLNGYGALP